VYSITLAKNGHTARTISGVALLDGARVQAPVADYPALRAYAGGATSVFVLASGIAGTFVRDATVTVDNGGTEIVGVHGWRRVFDGGVFLEWFLSAAQYADVSSYAGAVDLSAEAAAANTYAQSIGSPLRLSHGKYRINAGLDYKTPLIGEFGDGIAKGSIIVTSLADGTGCIRLASEEYWHLENLWIEGASKAQNFYGIKSDAALFDNRFVCRNVHVRKAKFGAFIRGYIGDLDIFIDGCETGFLGDQLNGVRARVVIETCDYAGEITNTMGLSLQLMYEGGATLLEGMKFNACNGITLDTPYFESTNASVNLAYMAKFGNAARCYNVKVLGGQTFGYNVSDAYFVFDQVTGLNVDQHWIVPSGASKGRLCRTTANTLRIEKLGFYTGAAGYWLTDTSKSARPLLNLFANGELLSGFNGFRNVGVVGAASLAVDTTNTRHGSGIKVTAPAGGAVQSGGFFRMPNSVRDAYKGKTLFLGVWLWVPNIAEFADLSNKSPAIAINDGTGATLSPGGTLMPGQWNLVHVSRAISAVATDLTMFVYAGTYLSGGYTFTGNEFVTIGGLYLIDATSSEVDPSMVASGRVTNSGMGGQLIGCGNIAIPRDGIPNDATQIWKVNDRILVESPAYVTEYICTVAGASGTWRAHRWLTKKDTTANRPALTANDIGVQYLDTTLDVDGKLITWTGTAWVDATGAVV
jgi:hypothetical protein